MSTIRVMCVVLLLNDLCSCGRVPACGINLYRNYCTGEVLVLCIISLLLELLRGHIAMRITSAVRSMRDEDHI